MPEPINPIEQATKIIRHVGNEMLRTDKPFRADLIGDLMGSPNEQVAWAVVDDLCEHGVMRKSQSLRDVDGVWRSELTLTLTGWQRFADSKEEGSSGEYGFIAMQFGNRKLNRIVDHLKQQIRQALDYDLVHVMDRERAGIIDEIIRIRIRDSRFVIADLTHDNSGAYWEAGYAEGLDKPVIYICEERKFRKRSTHFDTNHLTTITWSKNKTQEFAERLVATLRLSLEESG